MISKFVRPFVLSLFVILISGLASAQPDPGGNVPQAFWGEVTVNGNPAPDGWLVVARIDGTDLAGVSTSDGMYGVPEALIVQGDTEGELIEFFVNDVKGGEYYFKSGPSTHLGLSITGDFCGDGVCTSGESCSSCKTDCGSCPSPPSGGTSPSGSGSSGGAYVPPANESEPEVCVADWKCTDWFECYNGKQKRVCTDQNNCGTEEGKPSEVQECEIETKSSLPGCEIGEKTCQDGDAYICSNDGDMLLVDNCDYGCSAGECNAPDSMGGFFNSINSFFAGILGGNVEGEAVTGASTANPGLLILGAIVAVVLIGLALFFKFR